MSSPKSTTSMPPSWQHKYVHEMNSTERLESLTAWAEEKKFVRPGEGGTLPFGSIGGMNALVYGGSLCSSVSSMQSNDKYGGQYEAPIGPPSYQVAIASDGTGDKRKSAVRRWLEERKVKKVARREDSVPGYAP